MSSRQVGSELLAGTIALASAACSSDATGGGHIYTALNQSDHDVIVEIVSDERRVVRLPAHTRGHLSESWSGPIEGWFVTVRDVNCTELASFPLRGQPSALTVHVTAAGKSELGRDTLFMLEGKHVRYVSELASADCS